MSNPRLLPGQPQSLWLASTAPYAAGAVLPPQADVVIVGGGIVGLTTAHQLRDSGLSVVVLEAGEMAAAVTGHTTGKLTSQHGLRYSRLRSIFGLDRARQYAEANECAIEWVRATAQAERIDCDYTHAAANVYSLMARDRDAFREEIDVCREIGLPASIADSDDVPFSAAAILRFDRQAHFHPRKFLLGLADRLRQGGSLLLDRVRVREIKPGEPLHEVVTEAGVIKARHVVVATHYPIFDSGFFVAKLTPRRSYAIAADVRGRLPEGMYVTSGEPMHSFRPARFEGRDVLIIGGGHHKVGQADNTGAFYRDLEDWARRTFDIDRILFRWSTQDNETPDGAPYIGRSPGQESIYVATGFDGWGMSSGVVAGRILSDLITGTVNPWLEVFDPARVPVQAIPKLVSENLNVAAHLIGDKMASATPGRIESLEPGEGAVLESRAGRVCAYRDDGGGLHVVGSECTHMGCQLHWNSAELSWDCPCHGSRFSVDGAVLQGPAVEPLPRPRLDEL